MNSQKAKIVLKEEQETLLITLYSKAFAPDNIFIDPKAKEILAGVQYDFSRLKVPQKTMIMVCMRARQLDVYTRQFLARHPDGLVLHLGCGLDSRYLRVQPAPAVWFHLDMPPVSELRKQFFAETSRYQMISSSVTDLDWIDRIAPGERAVLVVAEGLLMYLSAEQVKALILRLQQTFPGCSLVFDAFSKLTARNVAGHPSLQKTGASAHWGIDDPCEIEAWDPGIHLKETWFFSQSDLIPKLGFFYRIGFQLAGSFQAAQNAHRILYYTL